MIHDLGAHPAGLHLEHPRQVDHLAVELPGGYVHEAHAHGQTGPVRHDHLTIAVGDRAARRDDLHRAQTVGVGFSRELLPAEDLQKPQTKEDDAARGR